MNIDIENRGIYLLCENGREGSGVYRGIMEMVSRFGFISIEEVMYGFDFPVQKAKDRLKYLTRVGLLERFESLTVPRTFFCLSPLGFQMATAHRVSDEILPFRPYHYNALNQRHDRMIIRIYLAMRKIFQDDFKGWIGERRLRQNENLPFSSFDPVGRRVLDGLFQLRIEKEKFFDSNQTTKPDSVAKELWWCGLELELTLKSAERYRKQFKCLANTVYEAFQNNQKIPMVLFLYGTAAIAEALRKYWSEERDRFGRCLFLFGSADQFLEKLGTAPMVRCLRSAERNILAHEMNRVRVRASSPQAEAPRVTAS